MTEPTTTQRKRLRARFGFTRTPFHKAMKTRQIYDSQTQRKLVVSLEMCTEIGAIALCTEPAGVGKTLGPYPLILIDDAEGVSRPSSVHCGSSRRAALRHPARRQRGHPALGAPLETHEGAR